MVRKYRKMTRKNSEIEGGGENPSPSSKKSFPKLTYISSADAIEIMDKAGFFIPTKATLIRYYEKYKLGRKIGGRWAISKTKLMKFLKSLEEIGKEEDE